MKKFRELKIDSESFNSFYSEFIQLAAELEFTKEILLREFKHNLFPYIQDRMNSEFQYPDNMKDSILRCRKIYNQMIATDHVRVNTKLPNTKMANPSTRLFHLLLREY